MCTKKNESDKPEEIEQFTFESIRAVGLNDVAYDSQGRQWKKDLTLA